MNQSDYPAIIAIAMLAARADGTMDAAEQAKIDTALAGIGSPDVSRLAQQVAGGQLRLADLAAKLSDDEARRMAWDTALAVSHADGSANAAEQRFLDELRGALGLGSDATAQQSTAGALAGSQIVNSGPPPAGPLDDFILQQAILTGALEVLPDRLANIAILPLQLRLVYQIGQKHGQRLDINQVKDLAATFGLGAATQAVEGVLMKVLGGLAGGLLGGLAGGAARIASGAAVTFAATYALGHVADQYYAQGRRISTEDLRALFARFQKDAQTIYPRVQQQIQTTSGSINLQSLLGALRGA
jgi:tellurite resistance protein/uncharacterized protein (DUF697 family)